MKYEDIETLKQDYISKRMSPGELEEILSYTYNVDFNKVWEKLPGYNTKGKTKWCVENWGQNINYEIY